ncbi:MAG: shikimate kinase [Calothrix sp. MO_192.B10]|nr:shikimate kinase [Calothrix sp. MO_192.B10]
MIFREKSIIYLIGMMGSGKTTTAPVLAQQLEYNWTDTDSEVEKVTKKSCYEIVDEVGVEGFRTVETKVLTEVTTRTRLVVACGGGIIMRQENWHYLCQDKTVVVWLNLSVEEIHKRIRDEPRPNLRGLDSQQLRHKLEEIFIQRRSLYAQADISIFVNSGETPQQVATKVNQELKKLEFCRKKF